MDSRTPSVVQFGEPPPDPSRRFIPVVSPKPACPVNLVIVGCQPVGCYVHWVSDTGKVGSGRTVPHTTPDDSCPICVKRGQLPRWHGYLACWSPTTSRYYLADITVYAMQTCPILAGTPGLSLRGRNLLLKREGRSSNSRVIAEVSDVVHDLLALPQGFDVEAALCRLWGVTNTRHWRLPEDAI